MQGEVAAGDAKAWPKHCETEVISTQSRKNNERALGTFFCVGKVVVFSISFDVRLLDFQMVFSPNFVFFGSKTLPSMKSRSRKVPSSFEPKKRGVIQGSLPTPNNAKNEVAVHSKSTLDLHLPFDSPKTRNLVTPIIAWLVHSCCLLSLS